MILIIVEQICDNGVHFWKEAWNFSLGGFWVCWFKKLQEPYCHSNGSRLKIQVPQLPWSRCLYPCFCGQGSNHAWPPSLPSNSTMLQMNKSNLMRCLKSLIPLPEDVPNVDVKIVDGAVLVHILDPKKS